MHKDPKQLRDHSSFIAAESEVSIAEVDWIDSAQQAHNEFSGHLESKKISAESCSVLGAMETGILKNQYKMPA